MRRLIYWLRMRRHDADLREELESHRALRQADLESRGLAPEEAAAASRRAMGNMTLAREDARDVWVAGALDRVWRDARHGARALRREPTFALAAIFTLALGVATTTTVFSVVDAELWKPLPFPDPDRLVAIRATGSRGPRDTVLVSGAELQEWRARSRTFQDLAGASSTARRVLRRATAESVAVTAVTPNYLTTMGRRAIIGRIFDASDAAPAAVLTDRAWRRLFNADPAVAGMTIVLDGQAIAVVGVIATDDSLGRDPDLFALMPASAPEIPDPSARTLNAIGRVQRGVDLRAAEAELQAVVARASAGGTGQHAAQRVELMDLGRYYTGYNWRPLYFFLAASIVVLVLSCVNVASLLFARALRRAREFAIRGALGGGRRALLRQLLVEGALIAVPGGLTGVLLTMWALAFFTTRLPEAYLRRGGQIHVDVRVCAFACAATALTALVFGLAPSLFARRLNLATALAYGGRAAGRSPSHTRARHLLLVTEVALTVVLLAAAGIFLKSFLALTRVPLGFDPQDRMAARVSLSGPSYASGDAVLRYAAALLDRARAIPGVREAAIATSSPLGSGPPVLFVVPERARPAPGEEPSAILRAVTAGYFQALGIRRIQGREFGDTDVTGAPRVAIVNERLARRMFPGEEALGRIVELLPGTRAPWTRRPGPLAIVGVVSNIKEVGLNEVEFNGIYVPFAQMPAPSLELVVRAGVPPAAIADRVRAAAAGVDPNMPVTSMTTFETRVANALGEDRFNLLLIASFAAVAIVLAGIGIYGAVAYAVRERTREFSVRLALGAPPRSIVRSALSEGARVGVAGGLAGIAASTLIARLLGDALYLVPRDHNGLLYGVTTTDPAALTSAFAGIVVVALLAAAGPARHVARVDPLATLRQE